jgi:NAD(P)H dehydrogenase (quinone)
MTRILVVFYSMYGNTAKIAKAVADGARSVDGVEVKSRQVDDLLPKEAIEGNPRIKNVKKELADIKIATKDDLKWADGVLFGSPTRFGNMSAQLKQYLDRTTRLWMEGSLIGKPAGVFTSTSTLHGGQESTLLSMMIPLLHHGMIIVGVPYSEERLFSLELGGGSPYGASSISGPTAENPPTEKDLAIARTLGKRVAEVAKKLRG